MVEINSDIWLNVKDLPHEIWKDIENFENLYKKEFLFYANENIFEWIGCKNVVRRYY